MIKLRLIKPHGGWYEDGREYKSGDVFTFLRWGNERQVYIKEFCYGKTPHEIANRSDVRIESMKYYIKKLK